MRRPPSPPPQGPTSSFSSPPPSCFAPVIADCAGVIIAFGCDGSSLPTGAFPPTRCRCGTTARGQVWDRNGAMQYFGCASPRVVFRYRNQWVDSPTCLGASGVSLPCPQGRV